MGSETNVNVDLYTKGDDFHSGNNIIGITNMTWNTINDTTTSSPMKNTYCPVKQNLSNNTELSMHYWLSIPDNQSTGEYTTSIYIKAVNSVYRYF